MPINAFELDLLILSQVPARQSMVERLNIVAQILSDDLPRLRYVMYHSGFVSFTTRSWWHQLCITYSSGCHFWFTTSRWPNETRKMHKAVRMHTEDRWMTILERSGFTFDWYELHVLREWTSRHAYTIPVVPEEGRMARFYNI